MLDDVLDLAQHIGLRLQDALPPAITGWTDDPRVVAGAVVGVVLLVLVALAVLLWRRARDPARQARLRDKRRIRQLTRSGKWLELGHLHEQAGRSAKALDAYRRGNHHERRVRLLRRLGKTREARRLAKENGLWQSYAELSEQAGEDQIAAQAYLDARKPYAAAQAYRRVGEMTRAAQAYLDAELPGEALGCLANEDGPQTTLLLDRALRAGAWPPDDSPQRAGYEATLRRTLERWISAQQPQRAYDLAEAKGRMGLALDVAIAHLEPSRAIADALVHEQRLDDAARVFDAIGDAREAHLQRAEHAIRRADPRAAAEHFDRAERWTAAAEQWALAGDLSAAAERFERAGEFEQAVAYFQRAGEEGEARRLTNEAITRGLRVEVRGEADYKQAVQPAEDDATTREPLAKPPDSRPSTVDPTRYRLLAEIGRGGMGVVYRAHDRILDRTVAYKLLQIGHADEALLGEARAAAKLAHPNIVQVYDAGFTEGGVFIVMEMVQGDTFATLLAKRSLSIDGIRTVGRQVCAALHHAHARGIVHRDLKPSNLMWTDENKVKLTDFGLARTLSEGGVVTAVAGTPYYMAPEQIRGEPLGPACDIYALGCVLYEMACKRTPFTGGAAISAHLTTAPDDPRQHRAELPDPLAELILACLAKDVAARPASAGEVGRRLRQ
ncbi:MAG: serine/threonine-protein kinase [Acidobacteriota bacterium]